MHIVSSVEFIAKVNDQEYERRFDSKFMKPALSSPRRLLRYGDINNRVASTTRDKQSVLANYENKRIQEIFCVIGMVGIVLFLNSSL